MLKSSAVEWDENLKWWLSLMVDFGQVLLWDVLTNEGKEGINYTLDEH